MTKLEAVALILMRNGMGPPSQLDTGGPSEAGIAERMIDAEEVDLQARGWHYNTVRNYDLEPDLYEISNASYTAATKTLTQAGAFSAATVGQSLSLSHASLTETEAIVTGVDSTNGNYVTLDRDIAAGDIASGITGEAMTNRIAVPAGTINIDADESYEIKDLTQHGGRLWDRDELTDMFSDPVTVRLVERWTFSCMPYAIQRYIALKAALVYNESRGNREMRGGILREFLEAEKDANKWNTDMRDINVLESFDAMLVRGGRSAFSNGYSATPLYGDKFWPRG